MSNVLVWVDHGQPEVFDLSLPRQVDNIRESVHQHVLKYYPKDPVFGLDEFPIRGTIEELVRWVNEYTIDDECFEMFRVVPLY